MIYEVKSAINLIQIAYAENIMTLKPKTAILLAADQANTLRAITEFVPRPLIRVAGRSVLKRALDRLVEEGVEKAIVVTDKDPKRLFSGFLNMNISLKSLSKLKKSPKIR